MGNCFGKRTNNCRYIQPHASVVGYPRGVKEAYKSSPKKLTYPLPTPPQPQKLPSPRHDNKMIFSPCLKSFTFSELTNATRCFCPNDLLGEGGFGYVYKGWLDKNTLTPVEPGSGIAVAVKKLKPKGFQGHKEWLSEITHLGQLHHPNLVTLIGFCYEGANRLLVYEFLPQGSLEDHLFRRGEEPLSWALRVKVAVEAARGLSYLHASESKIIYRDLKSSNVLLDMDYNVKLSDFGLAKAGPLGDWTHVTTQVMGTEGYTAPEYIATGRLTPKCDVYSFGIVLLELITGRHVIDRKRIAEEQKLLEWVRFQLREDGKKIVRIMDIKLEGRYSRKTAYIVANLALQCCHPEAKYRPDMSDVLSILEKIPSSRSERRHQMSGSKSDIGTQNINLGHMNGYGNHHGSPMNYWSPQGSPLMPRR